MKTLLLSTALLSATALSSLAMAQSPKAAAPAAVSKDNVDTTLELIESSVGENIWTNLLSVADQAFVGDNKQINIDFQDDIYRLNFDLGKKTKVRANKQRATFMTFALKGAVPLSGSDKKSSLPTLNELANGSTLTLEFSRTIVPLDPQIWDPAPYRAWIKSTEAEISARIMSGTAPAECLDDVSKRYWTKVHGAASTRNTAAPIRIGEMTASIADGTYTLDQLLAANETTALKCGAPQAVLNLWSNPDQNRDKQWIKTFGGNAKIGQEDFSFRDAITFQDMNVTETTYAFSAFGRFERGNDLGGTSISAAIELQHAFKDNDPSTVCRDPDDMATCVEAVFGPPQAEDSFVAKVSYASVLKGITVLGNKPVALSLNANYNIDEDIWGLEAPVFLYRDDKNLGAGIRGGWRSDTDNFEVGFFVSQKFSL